MIDHIAIKRIVFTSLLAYLVIAAELMLLTSYRILHLQSAAEILCSNDLSSYVICMNELIHIMLFGGQWSAVKYTVYVCTLFPIIFLLFLRERVNISANMLALSLVVVTALMATMTPAWIESAAVLSATLLVALVMSRQHSQSI